MPKNPLRSLIFVALFLAGVALGRLTAPEPALDAATAGLASPGGQPGLSGRALPSATEEQAAPPAPSEPLDEPRTDPWEALSSWRDDPRAALARQALEHSRDPEQAAEFLIDQMSDDQLIDLISGVTNFTPNDVADERDPRELARRLASIAMDGVLRDPAPASEESVSVEFATQVSTDNAAEQPSSEFQAGAERIYAVFPNEGYRGEEVVVKWYRTDRRELLMLRKHAVLPEDTRSYVWLEPDGGWPAGEYGVEFYSSTGGIEKLAEGRYSVR